MAASLDDPEIRSIVERYRTCELATLSRSGAPIAWPTSALYQPDRGVFVFTTSIGFPQKAYNVRRDARVGLLFSDPTGSGLTGMPEVFVQGEATCTDGILTSPDGVEGLEQWWERIWTMQPSGRSLGAGPAGRRLMDWYYRRLVLTVHPTRVQVRRPLPARAWTTPTPSRARQGSTSGEAFRVLSAYDSAVLAARDPDGTPWLLRVRPELDRVTGRLLVDVPADEPMTPGPASFLCHRHDDVLGGLHSAVVLGDLDRRDGRWALTPTRLVPGAGTDPVRLARTLVGCRRAARAYLERRHLEPPPVDWAAFAALKAEVARREAEEARAARQPAV